MTPKRIYRLDITPPPEAADPDWTPPGWTEFWYDRTEDPSTGFAGYVPPFTLPQRRHYFSKAAAEQWAARMRRWGCAATVTASDPITWNGLPVMTGHHTLLLHASGLVMNEQAVAEDVIVVIATCSCESWRGEWPEPAPARDILAAFAAHLRSQP